MNGSQCNILTRIVMQTCVCVCSCTTDPCGPSANVALPCVSNKINNIENKGARERKTDKSSLKKDKGNWPKGPKVSFCLHLG